MRPDAPGGILVVDKPAGWTSHDVVRKVKNLLGGVKVGHAGTLDPDATGVLVLLVGDATKVSARLTGETKRYQAVVRFGTSTDTYDASGAVTASGDPETVDRALLAKSVGALLGEIEQLPPLYSAVKVKGKPLHRYARAGKTVERTPRTVRIDLIEARYDDFPDVRIDIVCSKGTYIREIANRLGEAAGCPAHLSALRRTLSGTYGIEEAVTLETVAEAVRTGAIDRLLKPAPAD
jgi:tRNA pseudouridine55 synthase